MQKEFFPVQFDNMGSEMEFTDYRNDYKLISADGLEKFGYRVH